jgi:hypothetical protein
MVVNEEKKTLEISQENQFDARKTSSVILSYQKLHIVWETIDARLLPFVAMIYVRKLKFFILLLIKVGSY